ncbi:2Fe-2S iron-sulfur cluster-binding protein [Acidiphilium sp. AL]|uniref:2Fe-2S iron-sulfur cluster-binding protein n=1 Tax=Acidiphilium sp. AL TaxID=2871704 RepID=UPI0021CB87B4|nr:2Fe-2S iron-sulfur cluster-binding protein [Acidiphilium sp. AL]
MIEVAVGLNVMLGAIQNNVDGIDAECGGCLSCATCHVYVEPDYVTRLPPPEPDEAEMLDVTATPRRPTSRLSCQITVTQDLDGLIVQIPERQS